MIWLIFISSIALMLVLEGILPFLSPDTWRRMVRSIASQSDRSMRIYGFVCMMLGVGILYVVHH